MIPVLGSSIAAVVTEGANLVDSLQVSDVITGAFQTSVDTISSCATFEQGVVRCVGDSESLRKAGIKNREEFLKSLDNCGLTIDQPLAILNNGVTGQHGN